MRQESKTVFPVKTGSAKHQSRRYVFTWMFMVGMLLFCFSLMSSIDFSNYHNHGVGDKSVYVPGAGFSGFWYHLGLFQSMTDIHKYQYYCFSSACLSVVLGFLQTPVETAYGACRDIQQEWYRGELSTYEMVDEVLLRLLPKDESALVPLLSRMHIISTRLETGVEIVQPSNRSELVTLIKRTTWIPFLTGNGWLKDGTNHGHYLDGYFSLPLHPQCRYTARVPFSWSSYMHSLNPGVGKDVVLQLVQQGVLQTNPFETGVGWNTTRTNSG